MDKKDILQIFKQNISPLVRKVTKNNVEYLVIPMVMMLEQCVMNGVLYLGDAVNASATEWNGRAVVIYHPKGDSPISANNPETFVEQNVGVIFESRVEDKKLKADAWLEVNKLKNIDDGIELIAKLEANENIDVSTGMKIDGYKESGQFGGAEYTIVANQITPDHLAILIKEKGACSWIDGAGLVRNQEEIALKNKELNHNKELPTMDRQQKVDALIKSGVLAENQREAFGKMSDGDFGSFESLAKQNTDNAEIIAKNKKDAEKVIADALIAENKKVKTIEELQGEVTTLKENAQKLEDSKKQVHIDVILANKENDLTQEQLIGMDCEVLAGIAKLNKKADYSALGENNERIPNQNKKDNLSDGASYMANGVTPNKENE